MTRRILLTLAVAVAPLFGADVTGNWTFAVDLGGQNGTPKFRFTQKGEALTGTYSGQLGDAKLEGTVKGDAITFRFETSGITVTYSGTVVSATEMKGKADYGGQAEGTWTAKKD